MLLSLSGCSLHSQLSRDPPFSSLIASSIERYVCVSMCVYIIMCV